MPFRERRLTVRRRARAGSQQRPERERHTIWADPAVTYGFRTAVVSERNMQPTLPQRWIFRPRSEVALRPSSCCCKLRCDLAVQARQNRTRVLAQFAHDNAIPIAVEVDRPRLPETDRDAVSAVIVIVRHMQRLMHVTDEMQNVFQRENALGRGRRRFAQFCRKRLRAIDHASFSRAVTGWPRAGGMAITGTVEIWMIEFDVSVMPERAVAVPVVTPYVRPIGARQHIRGRALIVVLSKYRVDLCTRFRGQAISGDRGNEDMAFAPPR